MIWSGNMAMPQTLKLLATVLVAIPMFCVSASHAAFFGLPRVLGEQIRITGLGARINLGSPVLEPIGHTRFCLKYPQECTVHGIDFRRRNIALTAKSWSDLNTVNREVNRSIIPQVTPGNDVTDEWVIAPSAGDCKDYAITKRHELLARGWPSRSLLLSEVVVPDGEHHLVLVVRMKDVDLVLDNLNANIRPVATTFRQYRWVRIETPQNPHYWARVLTPTSVKTAMATD
jgi:predicted transglutaminase-like cysteine proteinase